MKKLTLILVLSLALLLCACSAPAQPTEPSTEPSTEPPVQSISIVIADESLRASAEALQGAMSGWTTSPLEITTGDAQGNVITLALEDLTAGRGIRPNDYRIDFETGKVTIVSGSDKYLQKAVEAFTKDILPTTNDTDLFAGTMDPVLGWNLFYKISSMNVGGRDLYDFVIVADESSESALELQEIISRLSLYELPIVSAAEYTEGDPAFIFTTGAPTLAADLESQQHLVKIDGCQVYMLSGDVEQENISYKMFLTEYLKYEYKAAKTKEYTFDFNEPVELKFTTKFDGTDGFVSTLNLVTVVPQQDNWYVQQGCTSDGRYAYFVMISKVTTPETGKIIKVDMENWEVVKVSDKLATCHSNDMCYNPELGKIVVVHNAPERTKLSIVDPDTLTVDSVIDIGQKVYCIGYSQARKQYMFGASSTDSVFHIYSHDFKYNGTVYGPSTGFLTQGGYADDDFIYAVRSPEGDDIGNFHFVFDWEGNYMTRVELDLLTESESMFRLGDLWYTVFNANGGMLYESIVYKVIE
jgi:hypothetical protein